MVFTLQSGMCLVPRNEWFLIDYLGWFYHMYLLGRQILKILGTFL